MAVENQRLYCARHGYDFVSEAPIARDRPACWAKIPAPCWTPSRPTKWALWADSDTLILEPSRPAR